MGKTRTALAGYSRATHNDEIVVITTNLESGGSASQAPSLSKCIPLYDLRTRHGAPCILPAILKQLTLQTRSLCYSLFGSNACIVITALLKLFKMPPTAVQRISSYRGSRPNSKSADLPRLVISGFGSKPLPILPTILVLLTSALVQPVY